MAKVLPICGVMILMFAASGCGDSGVAREAVSGSVTLDGEPLQEGSILFTPLGDGPSAGGDIKNGRYELPRERGPSPGRYRVEINSWRSSGKGVLDEATGQTDETLISVVPARYNRRSELEAAIEEGAENTFDFALESK